MHFPLTLSSAARQAFADCLENLQIDFERFRGQIQQQFVGLLGHRVGDWVAQTLFSILCDGSAADRPRAIGNLSENYPLSGDYETDWWEQQEQGVLEHSPTSARTPLTLRTLGLGLTIQAIIWWLRRKSQSGSGITLPLLTMLGSWLCDRLTR